MTDIKVGRGLVVRVQRQLWRGKPRVDVRTFFGFADADSVQPTRKGVGLDMDLLPQLIAALRDIEARAIRAGELLPEDYENVGLPLPPALTDAA